MADPVEEAKKKKLPLKSGPPTLLTVRVVRDRTGETVFGAEVTVEGLAGPSRKAPTKDKGAEFVLTPADVDGITSVTVTARQLIAGGDKPGGNVHGATHQEGTDTVTLTIGGPNKATIRLINPCLAAFPDPKTDAILARNLTLRQARDTIVRLHAMGEITLTQDPVFRHDATGCSVVSPGDVNTVRVGMKGAGVAKTVDYRFFQLFDIRKRTVGPNGITDLLLLQHRHAVGLFRFAKFMGRDSIWGATKIFHIGISGADPFVPKKGPGNRHTRGHCIDFGGIEVTPKSGPDAGKTIVMTVLFDWGQAPVPKLDPASPDKNRPRVLVPVVSTATNFTWPSGDTATLPYRLEHVLPTDNTHRRVFLDVYHFMNREYCDVGQVPGTIRLAEPDTSPGEMDGMTIHPDYPIEAKGKQTGREAHQNHLHAEMPDDLPDPPKPAPTPTP